jgi:hypothetical protein
MPLVARPPRRAPFPFPTANICHGIRPSNRGPSHSHGDVKYLLSVIADWRIA